MCVHSFANMEYYNVCVLCGVSEKVIHLDSYNVHSAPISRGYSRRLRFKTKVEKILLGRPQPKFNDPVWKFLEGKRAELVTPLCIRHALKGSNLVCKHYDNIKLFCDVFTNYKITPSVDVRQIQQYLFSTFSKIHSAWNFSSHPSFFSYTWLIRFLLERINSEYIVFLKPPTSTKRHEKYNTLLFELIPLEKLSGILDHVLVNNHSQND